MAIEEFLPEIPTPANFVSEFTDKRMMHTAMQVIHETPFSAIMYNAGFERAGFVESRIGIGPPRESTGIVVEIVNSDIECAAQSVEKLGIFIRRAR
jgi:hypothetical protein